jgi:glucose dehydrogenase
MMTDEQLAQKRKDADRRDRIKRLFSDIPEVRADAIDALKEAWDFDTPCFNLEELANCNPQAATLTAMRRDTIKEVITWITKIK